MTTPIPTPTPAPLANSADARTTDGTLKDQGNVPIEKLADVKPADASTDTKTEPKSADGVPEKYEFKLTEGQTIDQATVDAAVPIFKELALNQTQADKLIEFYNKTVGDRVKTNVDSMMAMREGWRKDVAADKEIGGKMDSVKADIGRALTNLPPALVTEFKSAMDLTGAGDHPAFIKAFYQLSQMVNEGKPVMPGGASPHGQRAPGTSAKPSMASAMYPNLPT